jgi:hypothetical protein
VVKPGFWLQGLTRTQFEAVANKLSILGVGGTFEYFVATAAFIVKQGVTYVFHVSPDLMVSARSNRHSSKSRNPGVPTR